MLPHWFWRVRFQTPDSSGETIVVAPHRAAAKKSIAASIRDVTVFESAESQQFVASSVAAQRFNGYYPRVKSAITHVKADRD